MKKTKDRYETGSGKAIIDFLINIPIFDALKPDELRLVAVHMNFMDMNAGEILFQEGDIGDYVCFVAEGSLDVLKKSEKGHYATLATLLKGRCA